MTTIPPMTHPLSRYWKQPELSDITLEHDFAIVSQETFDALAYYGASDPTGLYVGKMWRSGFFGDMLCWVSHVEKGVATIHSRRLVIRPPLLGWFANPDFKRASGDMSCGVCHLEYRRHPTYPLFPDLNLLCDGKLVKL